MGNSSAGLGNLIGSISYLRFLLSHVLPCHLWWLMTAAVQGSQCLNVGSSL